MAGSARASRSAAASAQSESRRMCVRSGAEVEPGREPQRDGRRAGGVGGKGSGLRRGAGGRRGGHVEISVAVGVAEADGGPLHARRVGAAGPEPGLARGEVEVEARRFEQILGATGGEREAELEHVGAERAELSAGRLSRSAERDPIRPHDAVDAECGAAEVGDAGQEGGERAGFVELDLEREGLGRLDLLGQEIGARGGAAGVGRAPDVAGGAGEVGAPARERRHERVQRERRFHRQVGHIAFHPEPRRLAQRGHGDAEAFQRHGAQRLSFSKSDRAVVQAQRRRAGPRAKRRPAGVEREAAREARARPARQQRFEIESVEARGEVGRPAAAKAEPSGGGQRARALANGRGALDAAFGEHHVGGERVGGAAGKLDAGEVQPQR